MLANVKKVCSLIVVIAMITITISAAFAEETESGKTWVTLAYFENELYQFGIDDSTASVEYRLDGYSRPQFWLVIRTDLTTFRILLRENEFISYESGIWFAIDFANQTRDQLVDAYWQLREGGTH